MYLTGGEPTLIKQNYKFLEKIIEHLDLKKPIYRNLAAYGHFGRPGYSWEETDKIKEISKYLS